MLGLSLSRCCPTPPRQAVAASGKPIEQLFDTYLYKKYNMTNTTYGPYPWNPSMAAGITSTGDDFEGTANFDIVICWALSHVFVTSIGISQL